MKTFDAEFSEFVLFSEQETRALDSRVVLRENRGSQVPYVTCLVRDKEVQLKPEEKTRQLWLARLIENLGYSRTRIAVEYPITFGRDSSKRADIVVFDADRPTVPTSSSKLSRRSTRTARNSCGPMPMRPGAARRVERRYPGRGLAPQES
jgi:hypothetical protein